jgi:non-ribosomal peptide synthetase component E (peptide arylation enzyme)
MEMLSMVTRSTYPGVVVPDGSIAQFVCERHEARAAKPALIDGSTDRVITYAELRDDVKRVSAGLQSLGVNRGDVVGLRRICRLRRAFLWGHVHGGGHYQPQ